MDKEIKDPTTIYCSYDLCKYNMHQSYPKKATLCRHPNKAENLAEGKTATKRGHVISCKMYTSR